MGDGASRGINTMLAHNTAGLRSATELPLAGHGEECGGSRWGLLLVIVMSLSVSPRITGDLTD